MCGSISFNNESLIIIITPKKWRVRKDWGLNVCQAITIRTLVMTQEKWKSTKCYPSGEVVPMGQDTGVLLVLLT